MTKDLRTSASRWRSLIVLGAAAALIASACGTSDDTTTTTQAPTTTVAAATTTTAAETTTTEEMMTLEPISLNIGSILPQTGGLSSIIAALEEPLRMGLEEINAVSPGLVTMDFADSGTDTAIASTAIDQYLTGDHNAIIGPASSGVALSIWDKVNTSEMLMCSGSSTGAAFSAAEFNPYHIRTAPSDDIQAPLLGNIIVDDGFANVAVVWRADEYGVGFGEKLADSVEAAGATVVMRPGGICIPC